MRTDAAVVCPSAIAVVAQQLKPGFRPSSTLQVKNHIGASCQHPSVFSASTVDVVDGEKTGIAFSAANTSTAILGNHLCPQSLTTLFRVSQRPFLVFLVPLTSPFSTCFPPLWRKFGAIDLLSLGKRFKVGFSMGGADLVSARFTDSFKSVRRVFAALEKFGCKWFVLRATITAFHALRVNQLGYVLKTGKFNRSPDQEV
mgnify:CR=1 FL=1